MTFVLGLVGESIPLQYLNTPSKDRMAEIKGRQILDKYNCASCHLVRPGQLEFKLSSNVVKRLDGAWPTGGLTEWNKDYNYLDHVAWNPLKFSRTSSPRRISSCTLISGTKAIPRFIATSFLMVSIIATSIMMLSGVFEARNASITLWRDGDATVCAIKDS